MAGSTLPQERCDFYVYILFRPDGRPCYVGKGCNYRWKDHERKASNPHLGRIIASAGGVVPKIKLREGLTNSAAIEIELALIAAIGRIKNGGPLVNLTDGGEGVLGFRASPEQIEANRLRNLGKKHTEQALAKLRAHAKTRIGVKRDPAIGLKVAEAKRGSKHSTESINKMSASAMGRKWSDDQRDKIVKALAGRRLTLEQTAGVMASAALRIGVALTPEHRAKLSASHKGKPLSAAHRVAIGAAHKGRIRSETARANIKAGWLKRKG